jgi:hypothetical protein
MYFEQDLDSKWPVSISRFLILFSFDNQNTIFLLAHCNESVNYFGSSVRVRIFVAPVGWHWLPDDENGSHIWRHDLAPMSSK